MVANCQQIDLVESEIGNEDVHDAHGNDMTLTTKFTMMQLKCVNENALDGT